MSIHAAGGSPGEVQMRVKEIFVILQIFCILAGGCGLQETPEPVLTEYYQLLDSLDEDRIGESINRLEAFEVSYRQYEITRLVKGRIEKLEDHIEGRFHFARDLAREGDLGRAEIILTDLATYLPGTSDGERAKEYLEFDFSLFKIQRLLMDQRPEEAEIVALGLLEKNPDPVIAEQVERQLDVISTMNRSMEKSEEARAQNACRILQIYLKRSFLETGSYPAGISLTSLDIGNGSSNESVRAGLSTIKDYRHSQKGFSFSAVSRSGRFTFSVTDSSVKPAH